MSQPYSTFVCSKCKNQIGFDQSICWISSKTNKLECDPCVKKESTDEAYERAMGVIS